MLEALDCGGLTPSSLRAACWAREDELGPRARSPPQSGSKHGSGTAGFGQGWVRELGVWHSRRNALKGLGSGALSALGIAKSPGKADFPAPSSQGNGIGPEQAFLSATVSVRKVGFPTREEFESPPRHVRPITWYFPPRPDGGKIATDLADLKKLGIGGVCLLPDAPLLKCEYLSPEFWQLTHMTIKEAIRQDFRIWLYDEAGYPSTSAGGYVLRHHPKYVVTGLEYDQGPVNDGAFTVDDPVVAEQMAEGGAVIATVGGGTYIKRVGDPLATIAQGRDGLKLPLSNLMDADAGREFISSTYEGYARTVGRHFGKEIEAIFTDEPCLHVAGYWNSGEKAENHRPLFPWVDGFPEYFYTKKGYDLLPLLPCLVKDAGPEAVNVRCDYWEVVCELVMEGYFDQRFNWCAQHNISSTGHMLLEEWLMTHLMFTGSLIRAAAREHIPGVDLIGPRPNLASLEHTMTGVGGVWVPKYISSAAHTRGRSDVMSESFAASGPTMTLEKMVATANWEYVAGVTELLPMSHQYARRTIPPNALETTHDEFYRDPTFFATYLARLRSMLSGGAHVADLGVLVPETSIWANYVPARVGMPYEDYRKKNPVAAKLDDDFSALSIELLRSQMDFDYLDDEIFVTAEVSGGKLHLADEAYSVLVIPRSTTMRYAVAEKVVAFRHAGGHVIACGALPTTSMERGRSQALKQALAAVPVAATPEELVQGIRKIWQPDLVLDRPDSKFYYLHRRKGGHEIYFLINMAEGPCEHQIKFRATGGASIWDPRTGEIKPFNGREVRIEGLSALFVVFGSVQA